MKKWLIIALTLTACGGSLSDEQRKRLREGMEQQQIMKVSDTQIVTAALDQGQAIFSELEKIKFDSTRVDAVAKGHHAKIRWIVPGSPNAFEIEKQLIEAYVVGAATGAVQDNVQKIWIDPKQGTYDSLLYSRPIVSKMPDGADKLEGIWNIYLSKKEIVLGIGEEK
jgi:hypothetical protein